ncbi:MAG TPA: hypothetical protein VF727_04345 [Allosphingosinicella sp.]|jgi:hypothetical protein
MRTPLNVLTVLAAASLATPGIAAQSQAQPAVALAAASQGAATLRSRESAQAGDQPAAEQAAKPRRAGRVTSCRCGDPAAYAEAAAAQD